MTIKILEADGKLNPEELDFFLKGNISLEKSSRTKPFPWLPDQGWEDIQRLVTVTPEAFSSLSDDIERNGQAWKEVWLLGNAFGTIAYPLDRGYLASPSFIVLFSFLSEVSATLLSRVKLLPGFWVVWKWKTIMMINTHKYWLQRKGMLKFHHQSP